MSLFSKLIFLFYVFCSALQVKPVMAVYIDKIFEAVEQNDIEEVKRSLLEDKGLVSVRDGEGKTPLHRVRTAKIAQVLLDHGADIKAKDKQGNIPLHSVTAPAVIELLLARDVEQINVRNNSGSTPLFIIVKGAHVLWPQDTMVKFLKRDFVENMKIRYFESIRSIALLLDHGARVNVEVSFVEKGSNNKVILAFAEDVIKRRQDGLSVKDIGAIKQLVMNEVEKLKPASVLKALDARIAEEKQKDSAGGNGGGGSCSKSFE